VGLGKFVHDPPWGATRIKKDQVADPPLGGNVTLTFFANPPFEDPPWGGSNRDKNCLAPRKKCQNQRPDSYFLLLGQKTRHLPRRPGRREHILLIMSDSFPCSRKKHTQGYQTVNESECDPTPAR